ncbi:unnamed protein product [Amoebophrya sp. A25]|nr:unnamed protein product [Amoebophrya sp. A25]|eukprot:GSA25T00016552001.1
MSTLHQGVETRLQWSGRRDRHRRHRAESCISCFRLFSFLCFDTAARVSSNPVNVKKPERAQKQELGHLARTTSGVYIPRGTTSTKTLLPQRTGDQEKHNEMPPMGSTLMPPGGSHSDSAQPSTSTPSSPSVVRSSRGNQHDHLQGREQESHLREEVAQEPHRQTRWAVNIKVPGRLTTRKSRPRRSVEEPSKTSRRPDPRPRAGATYTVAGNHEGGPLLRATVLTSGLLRLQYAEHHEPEMHNLATTAVINRRFPLVADVRVERGGDIFTLETKRFRFRYDTRKPRWPEGFISLQLLPDHVDAVDDDHKMPDWTEDVRRELNSGSSPESRGSPDGNSSEARRRNKGDIQEHQEEYGRWSPTAPYAGNLFGTIRTLDGQEAPDLDCQKNPDFAKDDDYHCRYGVLSRTGIALLDDTGMPVYPGASTDDVGPQGARAVRGLQQEDGDTTAGALRQSPTQPGAPSKSSTALQPRANPGTSDSTADLYFFCYGRDFRAALGAFRDLSGPAPIPPRWALGIWFTRWLGFDDATTRDYVNRFESSGVPLDVWIFDMNWHRFGDWGGFSWNRNLLPEPEKLTFDYFRGEKSLRTGLNVHDADGVKKSEEHFHDLVEALGLDPGKSHESLSFRPDNATYLTAVEQAVFRPLRVDVPWIDYQQGESSFNVSATVPNLNPTVMLNAVRSQRIAIPTPGERGVILSRFPGIGGHRYPVGFAGDQAHTWTGLQYLPFFTSTASNVGFGYWSHDIYGGMRTAEYSHDWELNTRWIQYGVYSPIFRMHDKGESVGPCADTDSCSHVSIWDHPRPYFDAEVAAMRERSSLLPYLYTAAHQTTDTGVPIVRPLYYDYPEQVLANGGKNMESYARRGFFFGDHLLVYPVVDKSNPNSTMAPVNSWLPPGTEWFDIYAGALINNEKDEELYDKKAEVLEVATSTSTNATKNKAKQDFEEHKPATFRTATSTTTSSRRRTVGDEERQGREVHGQYTLEEFPVYQDAKIAVPLLQPRDRNNMLGAAGAAVMSGITWRLVAPLARAGFFVDDDGVSISELQQEQDETQLDNKNFYTGGSSHPEVQDKTGGKSRITITLDWAGLDTAKWSLKVAIQDSSFSSRSHKLQLLNFIGRVSGQPASSVKNITSYFCRETSSTFIELSLPPGVGDSVEIDLHSPIWRNEKTKIDASSIVEAGVVQQDVVEDGTSTSPHAGKSPRFVSEHVVELRLEPLAPSTLLRGFRGALHKARKAKKLLDAANVPYGVNDRGRLTDACNAGVRLHYLLSDDASDVSHTTNPIFRRPVVFKRSAESDVLTDFWTALREGRAQVAKLEIAEPRRSQVLALLDAASASASASSRGQQEEMVERRGGHDTQSQITSHDLDPIYI